MPIPVRKHWKHVGQGTTLTNPANLTVYNLLYVFPINILWYPLTEIPRFRASHFFDSSVMWNSMPHQYTIMSLRIDREHLVGCIVRKYQLMWLCRAVSSVKWTCCPCSRCTSKCKTAGFLSFIGKHKIRQTASLLLMHRSIS